VTATQTHAGRLYRIERIAEAMCQADGHGIPWRQLSTSEAHALKADHYRKLAGIAFDVLADLEHVGAPQADACSCCDRAAGGTKFGVIGDGLWLTIGESIYRLDGPDDLPGLPQGRDAAIARALCGFALDRIDRRGVHSAAHTTSEG